MQIDTDVCVIGGGPSGASAALQLRNLGYRVCLIERQDAERPLAVEAFPATIMPLLGKLGVMSLIDNVSLARCRHSHVRWGATKQRQETSAFLADRGRFDLAMIRAARQAGAIVLAPARSRGASHDEDGWTVLVDGPDGRTEARARFLIEATGRGGDQTTLGPRTVALCGRWRAHSASSRPEMFIEADEHSWRWAVTLPDGSYAVTRFVDAAQCAGLEPGERSRLYRESTVSSSFAAMIGEADLAGKIRVRDASCRLAANPVTHRVIKVGDRAFAMDPISSQGTIAALQSGIQAGIVVNTILSGGDADAAMSFYRQAQADAVRHHRRTATKIHAESGFSTDFWRERSVGAEAQQRRSTAPMVLGSDACVRLSSDARLLELPTVDGEEICRKLSLAHPSLDRSVTWFAGVQIAPLLVRVTRGCTRSSLAGEWSRIMPAHVAESLVDWLAGLGILIADSSPPP